MRPSTGNLKLHVSTRPSTGDLKLHASTRPSTGDLKLHASTRPSTGDLKQHASARPSTGDLKLHASTRPSTGDLKLHASTRPSTGDLKLHASTRPGTGDLKLQACQARPNQITRDEGLCGPSTFLWILVMWGCFVFLPLLFHFFKLFFNIFFLGIPLYSVLLFCRHLSVQHTILPHKSPVVSAPSLTRLQPSGTNSLFLSFYFCHSVSSCKSSLKTILFSKTCSSVLSPWSACVCVCVCVHVHACMCVCCVCVCVVCINSWKTCTFNQCVSVWGLCGLGAQSTNYYCYLSVQPKPFLQHLTLYSNATAALENNLPAHSGHGGLSGEGYKEDMQIFKRELLTFLDLLMRAPILLKSDTLLFGDRGVLTFSSLFWTLAFGRSGMAAMKINNECTRRSNNDNH